MGKVQKSAYRQPVTPDGLRKIESGELKWFDTEMFSNLNTGVLEQYLDEKNRSAEGFKRSRFIWKKVAVGILVGMAFAFINQYIGLKMGIGCAGSLYISYMIGIALRWSPTDINVAYSAATGADKTQTGFIFTFPAIFLLAYSTQYLGYQGERLIDPGTINIVLPIVLISAILAGFMGVIYFIIFRRIWIVENPLPTPGFEATIKLLDIAKEIQRGTVKSAKRTIRLVSYWSILIFSLAFIRDYPLIYNGSREVSIIDWLVHSIFGKKNYSMGVIYMSPEQSKYTSLGFAFVGYGFALGWFMRFRIAFLITIGSFFTWLVVIPMIVYLEVPIYVPLLDEYLAPTSFPASVIVNGQSIPLLKASSPAHAANMGIARLLAIGTILGGGITALVKMVPTIKTATADIRQTGRSNIKSKDWISKKGWYEWPVSHIKPMMIVTIIAIGLIFTIGGFPILQSFAFSTLLVLITFILGAIATKVGGEFGSPPVSGTSFLCLLLLVLVFSGLNVITPFQNKGQLVIMALIGTTVFGTAIALSSDVIWDFKVALYTGTRPSHIMKGELTGIFFGTFISVIAAIFFSTLLAKGSVEFPAPQAYAFATFSQILMGGKVMYSVFLMGILIGVFIELLTGLGTAFGIGMYWPFYYGVTFLTGGALRDIWEKKWLEPKAKENNWTEKEKSQRLITTYMIATAVFIGEAVFGIIYCLYFFF